MRWGGRGERRAGWNREVGEGGRDGERERGRGRERGREEGERGEGWRECERGRQSVCVREIRPRKLFFQFRFRPTSLTTSPC